MDYKKLNSALMEMEESLGRHAIGEQEYMATKDARKLANEIQKEFKEFVKGLKKRPSIHDAFVVGKPAIQKGTAEGPNSHLAGYEFRIIIK